MSLQLPFTRHDTQLIYINENLRVHDIFTLSKSYLTLKVTGVFVYRKM